MFHIKGHQAAQQAAEHRTSFHFKGRLGSQYPHFLSTIGTRVLHSFQHHPSQVSHESKHSGRVSSGRCVPACAGTKRTGPGPFAGRPRALSGRWDNGGLVAINWRSWGCSILREESRKLDTGSHSFLPRKPSEPWLSTDLWPQLFSDVNCIALWISSEKILTRLYSILHWFHKRLEVNIKNSRENLCFQTIIVFSFGSFDNSNKCTVLWKITARLITVSTSVNNEMWVKLRAFEGLCADNLRSITRLSPWEGLAAFGLIDGGEIA